MLMFGPPKGGFSPTAQQIAAAELVHVARALEATVRPTVTAYQREILTRHQWRTRPEFVARMGDRLITEPDQVYLISEAARHAYDLECRKARDEAGFTVAHDDQCPLLMAEYAVQDAENALLLELSTTPGLENLKRASRMLPETRARAVELALKLMTPFIHPEPGAAPASTEKGA